MIRIPECPAGIGPDTPYRPGSSPRTAAKFLYMMKSRVAIRPAHAAHAAVAFEDLFTKVAGIAAELPLFDAPIGAEREASFGDLEVTPAAKIAAVGPFGQRCRIGPAAGHSAQGAHCENILALERLKGFMAHESSRAQLHSQISLSISPLFLELSVEGRAFGSAPGAGQIVKVRVNPLCPFGSCFRQLRLLTSRSRPC